MSFSSSMRSTPSLVLVALQDHWMLPIFSNLHSLRGELQCIGASTLDEYRQHIEKDGALDRRFQKVMVDPPTAEETIHILHNIKGKYEEFHNVSYDDEACCGCVCEI